MGRCLLGMGLLHTTIGLLSAACCVHCQNLATTPDYILCDECKYLLPHCVGLAYCNSCGIPINSEVDTCMDCREHPYPLAFARSLWWYQGVAASLIQSCKFESNQRILPLLLASFSRGLQFYFTETDPSEIVLCPVPPDPLSRFKRGFDIPGWLCAHQTRFTSACLIGRKTGASQKSLSRAGRLNNLQGKLFFRSQPLARSSTVLLVDDVWTTGASLQACAQIILEAGFKQVNALVLCRD